MDNMFTFEDFVVNFNNNIKSNVVDENQNIKNIIYAVLSTIDNLTFEEVTFLTSNGFLDENDGNKLLRVVKENLSLIDSETKLKKEIMIEKVNICLALEKSYDLFNELSVIESRRSEIVNKINNIYSNESVKMIKTFIDTLKKSNNDHAISIARKVSKYV